MPTGGAGSALRRTALVAPIQRSQSNSGAFLALAADGREYWVKPHDNPQGIRTLAAEVIVYGVGRLVDAPVREIVLMDIPSLRWRYAPQSWLHQGIATASLNVEPVVQSDEWSTFSHLDNNRERQNSAATTPLVPATGPVRLRIPHLSGRLRSIEGGGSVA